MSNATNTGSVAKGREQIKSKGEIHTVYTIKVRLKDTDSEVLYVGRSKKFKKRLKQHKRRNRAISHYTSEEGQRRSEYELLDVVETEQFEELDKAQYRERQRMVELADEHGVENVAGGG